MTAPLLKQRDFILVYKFYPPGGDVGDEEQALEMVSSGTDAGAIQEAESFLKMEELTEARNWIAYTLLRWHDLSVACTHRRTAKES